MTALSDTHFLFFVDFLRDSSGYHLLPEKKYLLETRLETVLKSYKLQHIDDIVSAIRIRRCPLVTQDVINAMTVNETFFFRDMILFENFEKQILPDLINRGITHLSIWSAACSTGQEPYSLAILLNEYNQNHKPISFDIIATDINRKVIDYAAQGSYTDLEINRGLPEKYRNKYFSAGKNGWTISDDIRKHVTFKYCNLLENFAFQQNFHFIMLRNVLIYFNSKTRSNILSRIIHKLSPHGRLLLGAAESIFDDDLVLTSCSSGRGMYKLKQKQLA